MTNSVKEKIKRITNNLNVDYERINIHKYISETDKECLKMMADLYDEPVTEEFKEKFREIYKEGRKYYSTKQQIAFPL